MLKTVILPVLDLPELFLKPTTNFFNFKLFKENDDRDNLCLHPLESGLNFFKKIDNYLKFFENSIEQKFYKILKQIH